MKKVIALLLASVLLLTLIAACGSATQAPTTRPAPPSSGWTPGAGYAGKYDPSTVLKIAWVTQGDRPVDPNSEVKKVYEEKFNLDIDYIYIQRAEQAQLLGIQLAAGDIPDVWRCQGEARYREYASQGVLAAIPEDMIYEVMPVMAELMIDNYKHCLNNIFDFMKDNGEIYALPAAELNSMYMLTPIWRDDWLANVGINSIPATVEEAEAAFYAFTNNDPDQNGVNDTYGLSNNGIDLFLYGFGGPGNNALVRNGKVTRAFLEPEFKQGIGKIIQFYADGLIDEEFATGENRGQSWFNSIPFYNNIIGYTNGQMFYHINPPNPYVEGSIGGGIYEGFYNLNPDSSYAVGKALKGPYPELISPRWGIVPGNYHVFGSKITEEKMVRILQITEAIATDYDTFILFQNGLEDITYRLDYNDAGQPMYTGIGDPAAQYQPGVSTEGLSYLHGNQYDFLRRSNVVLYGFAEEFCTPAAIGNPIPYQSPIFATFDEDVRDAVSVADTRWAETRNLLITGQVPFNDAEWDKFVTEMRSLGIDRWIEAAQKWYDETIK